ncbi:MAG: hypothetical protein IAG10_00210, partial [Planctomycetaceae bacterium]|nr:hypothetical protein [Planctomycetaceae bacterium]
DFDDLNLSKLPTRNEDDSAAGASKLFSQFLRLAGFARLKRDLASGTDDLVTIFENARRIHPKTADADQEKTTKAKLLDDLSERLANLTRRDRAVILAAGQALGFAAKSEMVGTELRVEAPDFVDERRLWRIWQLLQEVEKLGVGLSDLQSWATPAPTSATARDLRDTVKARYDSETWQRVAQPIFDKLRQRQRDALVAFILSRKGFERVEQLFEYFLIDPGMEPVVQTSRVRLAISSLQTFIQRCLLNFEKQVHPTAINSQHWEWMSRYRVWEANRKIFLFPENWLEPEFRDDKTHLFQELEGTLLQGDVSNDLVEGAFFKYLKGLEALARLDIVAMYCEQKPESGANILHVVGRTFGHPHKYFYRRYAQQMWTPWEPVPIVFDGDHIVAVFWRERLHLFWVTFLEKPQAPNATSRFADNATVGQIANVVSQTAPPKTVEAQLNWSEFFQGEWATRVSSGFMDLNNGITTSKFDSRNVFIFVSKEYDDDIEQAVKINLTGEIFSHAFRLVSKNSGPRPDLFNDFSGLPYSTQGRQATKFRSSGALAVSFIEEIINEDDKLTELKLRNSGILGKGDPYTIATCNDLFAIDLPGFLRAGAAGGTQDLTTLMNDWFLNVLHPRTLISPFFYQDATRPRP